jgi:hypothetical protein
VGDKYEIHRKYMIIGVPHVHMEEWFHIISKMFRLGIEDEQRYLKTKCYLKNTSHDD